MNNMNIDENTMKNIKNMVDNGNLSDAISQISPEMMQNFSKMLSNQNNSQNGKRKCNLEKESRLGAAVNFSCLIQLFRNVRLEEGSCHDHVVYA